MVRGHAPMQVDRNAPKHDSRPVSALRSRAGAAGAVLALAVAAVIVKLAAASQSSPQVAGVEPARASAATVAAESAGPGETPRHPPSDVAARVALGRKMFF